MSIFDSIAAKPWLADPRSDAGFGIEPYSVVQARRLALRVFLAVLAMLFMLLLVAYAGRMAYEDWRPAPQLRLLWANTAALLVASACLQWALLSARRRKLDALRAGVLGAGAFTLVFLYGQVLAWSQLAVLVLGDLRNPAVGFFYLITGIHGAHLLGGLVALARTAHRVFSTPDFVAAEHSVGNCALYWHALLLIWLVLFGLLFSGNNFELLLEICGLR